MSLFYNPGSIHYEIRRDETRTTPGYTYLEWRVVQPDGTPFTTGIQEPDRQWMPMMGEDRLWLSQRCDVIDRLERGGG